MIKIVYRFNIFNFLLESFTWYANQPLSLFKKW